MKAFLIGFGCLAIFYLLFIQGQSHFTTRFEIGKCYEIKNDDPFRERSIRIKVLDKKEGYVKYYFIGGKTDDPSYWWSNSERYLSIYKPCPCE